MEQEVHRQEELISSHHGQNNGGDTGSGTTTKPSGNNGTGGACGKLTASECSQAKTHLEQQTAALNRQKGILALIFSFIPLAFDAIPFVKNVIALMKSFSLQKLFETIGDGIPVFLDISAILTELVALTG